MRAEFDTESINAAFPDSLKTQSDIPNADTPPLHPLLISRYEDGDLSFGLKGGVVNVLAYIFLLRAQIALKPSEIESMGSSGSILMSTKFSDSI